MSFSCDKIESLGAAVRCIHYEEQLNEGATVMAEQTLGPRDFFAKEAAIADLALLACPGAEELCKLVDGHLVRWAREVGMDVDTFIIRCFIWYHLRG